MKAFYLMLEEHGTINSGIEVLPFKVFINFSLLLHIRWVPAK